MESLVVSVTIPQSQEDALVGFLCERGSVGVEVQNFDAGQVTLRAFFAPDHARLMPEILAQLAHQLPEASQRSLSTATVPDEDWVQRWQQSLSPFPVGESFLIVPSLSSPQATNEDRRIKIFIEPGMAFGTGTHESTQLCLQALETLDVTGKTVLDLGTGAGILAIAAAHLGARRVLACDVDPVAMRAAMRNFTLNHVGDRVLAWCGSVHALRQHAADLAVANLTARIFEDVWLQLDRVVRPEGQIICSGILSEQAENFRLQLTQHHFRVEQMVVANEWVGVVARKDKRT